MTSRMKRREFLPLLGAGTFVTPLILSACSGPDKIVLGARHISLPGSITYSCNYLEKWDVIVSDWNAETTFNLTKDMPGDHKYPVFGPNGEVYFSSETMIEPGTVERSINSISSIQSPEESLTQLISVTSSGDHYEWVERPEVTPDGSKLIFTWHVYQIPEESGLGAVDLPNGDPYLLVSGLSSIATQLAFIPGTNTALFPHFDTDSPSFLKEVNISTGIIEDYLFTATDSYGGSFNDSRFLTITIDRDKNVYGVATSPSSTNSWKYFYKWSYENPSYLSQFGPSMTPTNLTLGVFWNDLRFIESPDGGEDLMLLVYVKDSIDNNYSMGYSRISKVASSDWEPNFIRGIVSKSHGEMRNPSWTPHNIDEL